MGGAQKITKCPACASDLEMMFMKGEEQVTLGPQSKVRVGVVVVVVTVAFSLVGSLTILAWNASSFASSMATDMSWVKTSLSTIVTRFDQVEQLKIQVDRLERFGSQQAQDLLKRESETQARLKVVEEFGCPNTRTALDTIKKQLEDLNRKFEMHEATTQLPKP